MEEFGEKENREQVTEISVWDYLVFKLNPANRGKELLPESLGEPETAEATEREPSLMDRLASKLSSLLDVPSELSSFSPVAVLAGMLSALAAQYFSEPLVMKAGRMPLVTAGFYALSILCFVFAFISGHPEETHEEAPAEAKLFSELIRYDWLALSAITALAAFLFFGGNRFTFLNVSLWILSLIFATAAFAESERNVFAELWTKIRLFFRRIPELLKGASFRISGWNLLCFAVFALGCFFRFYQLNEVPLDMFSDQAEKLYDVMDVLDGKTPIFFTRNTGREAFQFYWTALIIKLFGTGISFLSLKIGTALAGIFILPFVYLLGKKIGNRWVGLIAMLLTGVSYWPNVIGRVALRFAFYPMFTAPALWFLYKGLSSRSRHDLILSGIFLGIGLHGYSPFRIVPIIFVVIFLLWLFMDVEKEARRNALTAFLALVLFAFLVFLPLARVTVDMPEAVFSRSLTRLGQAETSYESGPFGIFLSNLWKALVMPFWSDGQTWVHSIVYRPALDHLSGSFYFIGLVLLILRFIRRKSWEDLCLLVMIPLLMMPSILSLAFPNENPCLNRTGGALIPIMLVTAYGFCSCIGKLLEWMKERTVGSFAVSAAALLILVNICGHNYDLTFIQYNQNYTRNAWNTTQVGGVIRGFAESVGKYENAYVIPNAHWVDTRLVGINAGDPKRDYALDPSLLDSLYPTDRPRLFIFRTSDAETRYKLRELWPNGLEELHIGPYEEKNFSSYLVMGE